jgi:CRISPR type III-A-associated protein Csm2
MSEFENEQTPAETASEASPAGSIETTPEPVAAPAPEPVSAAAVEAEPASAVDSAPAPSGEAANEESGSPQAKSGAAPAESRPAQGPRPPRKEGEGKPRGDRPPRPERGERPKGGERREGGERQDKGGDRPKTGERREGGGERREGGGERRDDRSRGRDARPGPRDHGRPFGRPDLPIDIELEKLLADSLYLDNQAHAVVSRIRDMDAGTRSQVRRLFSAVRRACRAAETDRQHQFVMLRARLAYTIARHQLRSLDPLERLLLQVTRKNDPRAYERFRDLFEAIVAYNE